MNILLTGGTGFIGRHLGKYLSGQGHKIWLVTRHEKSAQNLGFAAKILEHDLSKSALKVPQEIEAVIHLAGENITSKRWSKAVKEEILRSRVQTTRNLTMGFSENIKHFISSSAIGFYGSRGNETLTEDSAPGNDFLSGICQKWEAEATKVKANFPDLKLAILRTGIVLGTDGGALEKMLGPFKAGAGGVLGNGKQWMSWIHIDDFTGLVGFILKNNLAGVFNATSPGPVTNHDFSKALGLALHRPVIVPIPEFGLKLMFGEMADALLASQKAEPRHALTSGFQFRYPQVDGAFSNLLKT